MARFKTFQDHLIESMFEYVKIIPLLRVGETPLQSETISEVTITFTDSTIDKWCDTVELGDRPNG